MSFMPAHKNHKIWIGSTFHYRFQLMSSSAGVTSAQDVTGFTGTMTIEDPTTSAVLLTLTNTSGGIVFNGTSGLIDLIIPAATTAGLLWTQGKYQLLVVNPGTGETLPLLTGAITVAGL